MQSDSELKSMDAKCSCCCNAKVVPFAFFLPTVVTLIYFVLLADASAGLQQAAGGIGKGIQFLLPIVWVFWIQKTAFKWSGPKKQGVLFGLGFGFLILGAMAALYYAWLKPAGIMDATSAVAKEIQAKVLGMGINSPAKYWALGLFYTIVHSGLEEYYWRWFVFGQLRKVTTLNLAIALSAIGFTLHHILLLGTYFGYGNPVTWIFSFAITVGGIVWAWLYNKCDSIYPSWFSHMIVDAAIFIVGYDVIRTVWN